MKFRRTRDPQPSELGRGRGEEPRPAETREEHVTEENYILSAAEKMALKDEQRELENAVKEAESGVGVGTKRSVDTDYLKKKANHIANQIIKGTAPKLNDFEKDKLYKEAKELAEQIKEGMPTKDEMLRPEKHPGAITKHINWEKRNYAKIMRLKQINRMLSPDDPTAGNVESLREER